MCTPATCVLRRGSSSRYRGDHSCFPGQEQVWRGSYCSSRSSYCSSRGSCCSSRGSYCSSLNRQHDANEISISGALKTQYLYCFYDARWPRCCSDWLRSPVQSLLDGNVPKKWPKRAIPTGLFQCPHHGLCPRHGHISKGVACALSRFSAALRLAACVSRVKSWVTPE